VSELPTATAFYLRLAARSAKCSRIATSVQMRRVRDDGCGVDADDAGTEGWTPQQKQERFNADSSGCTLMHADTR
jgi:hypothetical protein